MTGRRVKIVCTIGPACQGRKDLVGMARAGMDVARLNFAHGDRAEHARAIRLLRDVAREVGRPRWMPRLSWPLRNLDSPP